MVTKLKTEDFKEKVFDYTTEKEWKYKGTVPAIIDFYADWCGPCKMMRPILEDLKGKIGNKAKIIKVDVDRNPAVSNTYNIRSIPTLILFKNGEIKWRQAGVVQSETLRTLIESHV